MSIFTSNFSRHGKEKGAVAISATVPSWFKGYHFPALAPPMSLVSALKQGRISETEYTEIYWKQIEREDPANFIWWMEQNTMYDSEPEGEPSGYTIHPDLYLLCWCARDAFCHRRIVARRIIEEGFGPVPEAP